MWTHCVFISEIARRNPDNEWWQRRNLRLPGNMVFAQQVYFHLILIVETLETTFSWHGIETFWIGYIHTQFPGWDCPVDVAHHQHLLQVCDGQLLCSSRDDALFHDCPTKLADMVLCAATRRYFWGSWSLTHLMPWTRSGEPCNFSILVISSVFRLQALSGWEYLSAMSAWFFLFIFLYVWVNFLLVSSLSLWTFAVLLHRLSKDGITRLDRRLGKIARLTSVFL